MKLWCMLKDLRIIPEHGRIGGVVHEHGKLGELFVTIAGLGALFAVHTLSTTVLPQARAGPSFQAIIRMGKFLHKAAGMKESRQSCPWQLHFVEC